MDDIEAREMVDSLMSENEELKKNLAILRERNFALMNEKNAAIAEASRLRKALAKKEAPCKQAST